MARMIFVNLPVRDLTETVRFYGALGFSFNPKFTDETATCMVVSDTIYVMLLTRERFADFTPKSIVDARAATEVLLALNFDSREDVDAIMDKAIAAGGREARPPQDLGFMYGRAFEDPDGHIWEPYWMDPKALE